MAQLCKEKKFSDAEKLLIDLKEPTSSPHVLHYLLQIYLNQEKVDEAVTFAQTLDDYKNFRLGIVRDNILYHASTWKIKYFKWNFSLD